MNQVNLDPTKESEYMFTAFTSSETEKVKKGLRKREPDLFKKKEKPISSNVNSKPDLELKPYEKCCDLSEYG